MKNYLMLIMITGSLLLGACSAQAQTVAPSPEAMPPSALPDEVVSTLDEFLQSQVYSEGADPQTHTPGLVLLAETPEGRYLQAAGVSSLEDGTPMRADDRLEIGSNTKSFTIVLLLQLQEHGLLSLDDPLHRWLPVWADRIPHGDWITLHQLAQHTSGIWDYGDPIIGEAANDPARLSQGYTPGQLVEYAIDNGTPDFAPGEEGMWNYSNTGYILLGMVIEKATGKSLGELYQERIFDPLGLETAILISGVPGPDEITDGYWWTDDGTINNTTSWNASQGWAAGAIAMNAQDLADYGKALAAGKLFENPDTLAEMLVFDPNGLDGMAPYGLGLVEFGKLGAPGSWGHAGQTAGFQSLWYTNPETGVTVVGLTNSAAYSAWIFATLAALIDRKGAEDSCDASGGYQFVCGPQAAEDLVLIPGTRWIIASGMAPDAAIYLIDSQQKTWAELYPGEAPLARQDMQTFGACPGSPDPNHFITHGLNIRQGENGHSTLYVVGHGGREAIEVFDVDASGEKPVLTWTGCVMTPDGMEANGVASFDDGSLVATIPLHTGRTITEAVAGDSTGAVYAWSPGDDGFIQVEGTELPYGNGIEVSSDGDEFYVVSSGLSTLTAFSNSNPAHVLRTSKPMTFLPDNLHMGSDGRLITGGLVADDPECGNVHGPNAFSLEEFSGCPRPFIIEAINPQTMESSELARGPANPFFSNITMGLPVGDEIWIGTFAGDRVAWRLLAPSE